MSTPMPENSWEKRQKDMQKRLESLPKSNSIIKRAVLKMDRENGENDVWKKFEIIDKLVSAARTEYTDGATFNEVVKSLSDALLAVVDKSKKSADSKA